MPVLLYFDSSVWSNVCNLRLHFEMRRRRGPLIRLCFAGNVHTNFGWRDYLFGGVILLSVPPQVIILLAAMLFDWGSLQTFCCHLGDSYLSKVTGRLRYKIASMIPRMSYQLVNFDSFMVIWLIRRMVNPLPSARILDPFTQRSVYQGAPIIL